MTITKIEKYQHEGCFNWHSSEQECIDCQFKKDAAEKERIRKREARATCQHISGKYELKECDEYGYYYRGIERTCENCDRTEEYDFNDCNQETLKTIFEVMKGAVK